MGHEFNGDVKVRQGIQVLKWVMWPNHVIGNDISIGVMAWTYRYMYRSFSFAQNICEKWVESQRHDDFAIWIFYPAWDDINH